MHLAGICLVAIAKSFHKLSPVPCGQVLSVFPQALACSRPLRPLACCLLPREHLSALLWGTTSSPSQDSAREQQHFPRSASHQPPQRDGNGGAAAPHREQSRPDPLSPSSCRPAAGARQRRRRERPPAPRLLCPGFAQPAGVRAPPGAPPGRCRARGPGGARVLTPAPPGRHRPRGRGSSRGGPTLLLPALSHGGSQPQRRRRCGARCGTWQRCRGAEPPAPGARRTARVRRKLGTPPSDLWSFESSMPSLGPAPTHGVCHCWHDAASSAPHSLPDPRGVLQVRGRRRRKRLFWSVLPFLAMRWLLSNSGEGEKGGKCLASVQETLRRWRVPPGSPFARRCPGRPGARPGSVVAAAQRRGREHRRGRPAVWGSGGWADLPRAGSLWGYHVLTTCVEIGPCIV